MVGSLRTADAFPVVDRLYGGGGGGGAPNCPPSKKSM